MHRRAFVYQFSVHYCSTLSNLYGFCSVESGESSGSGSISFVDCADSLLSFSAWNVGDSNGLVSKRRSVGRSLLSHFWHFNENFGKQSSDFNWWENFAIAHFSFEKYFMKCRQSSIGLIWLFGYCKCFLYVWKRSIR